ncbi:MAG: GxxExxY protein [Bacteroidetes bacterium]|nr:GxxExxY protein [Bacteroidota bacterium]
MTKEQYNNLSAQLLDASMAVHREMGPGLIEGVYHQCLVYELRSRGIMVESTVGIPLIYKGIELGKQYIADMIVDKEILIELKAIDGLLPIHEAQIISYLKLSGKRLGFLINFNVPLLKDGFRRFVNNF